MITLAETSPQIIDSNLTIERPASRGITISGGGAVQVMTLASGAMLNLNGLIIANGFVFPGFGGGI